MKLFLGIAAILALLFGAMLLFMPVQFYGPTGMALSPLTATIAQAHGATLMGLGIITWLAREADRRGLIAVLGGSLIVQILSLGVALRTMTLGAGTKVAPAVAIHIILGGFFAWFLVRVAAKPQQ